MTSQQIADSALALYQAHRNSPEIEALIDQFFSFPTSNEYEEIQSCVHAIFSERPIYYSDLPQHLSEAL
jgi:hypothetical protein